MVRAKLKRGRCADEPQQIPVSGWLDIVWRVKQQVMQDLVALMAAGVAFNAMLALFPTIAAIISIWALVMDPQDLAGQIVQLSRYLPPDASSLINDQARRIGDSTSTGLSLTALGSVVVAMFIASKGVLWMVIGLNVVYGEEDSRGALHRGGLVAALTLGLILVLLITIAFIAFFPLAIGMLALDTLLVRIIAWLRWPVLLLIMMLVIAVFYRFGPCRRSPRWRWISVGSVVATLLWLIGSAGLSFYFGSVIKPSDIYGSLGAVVVLMLWFWLSAFVVLLGAEFNAEMERQTYRDTTVGAFRPPGERDAYAADTLGRKWPWRRVGRTYDAADHPGGDRGDAS
ncbi:YihY/virulence factor BrkB family protein [Halomonas saccharevitans]|uniref:YihY/virulence factor BrkB family protein n=1 Tax=Halomonas saccharevitans TaxID=416872 RepID=A0ABU3NJ43_9GAMM|nr:YihY/virulence factor BrkB family protein [Halomonas saccharevitans]MDT8880635.1 YihY/virulence factor BrkB family protein [Halomonas saccharevitans]